MIRVEGEEAIDLIEIIPDSILINEDALELYFKIVASSNDIEVRATIQVGSLTEDCEVVRGKGLFKTRIEWSRLLNLERALRRVGSLQGGALHKKDRREVEWASIYEVLSNGALAGSAALKDGRQAPFKGDALLDEIQGEKIVMVWSLSPSDDDILVGEVELKGSRHVFFKDDVLIKSIGGRKVVTPGLRPRFLSDGTMVGVVIVEGCERPLLFRGDALIDRIQRRRFMHISLSEVLPGDVLAGEVKLKDGRRIPLRRGQAYR